MTDPQALRKKTVLLVDVNPRSREERSRAMRELGAAVDCAANAVSAVSLCQSGSYNLVLVDLGNDVPGAERLAEQIKAGHPRPRVAFLVGRPLYVTSSLRRQRGKAPGAKAESFSGDKAAAPVASIDFGQRIRNAEAEAETRQNSAEEV